MSNPHYPTPNPVCFSCNKTMVLGKAGVALCYSDLEEIHYGDHYHCPQCCNSCITSISQHPSVSGLPTEEFNRTAEKLKSCSDPAYFRIIRGDAK